jgi:hypothetical protein
MRLDLAAFAALLLAPALNGRWLIQSRKLTVFTD